MSNAPSELELLRRVASAALWAIESNGDDPVGRDGRARVGLNWVMANGELNLALKALIELYPVEEQFSDLRKQADEMQRLLHKTKKPKKERAA